SFLQNLPFSRKRHRFFPPLMPLAIEQFDFSKYDIVLSDSSSYAKGIITRPETLHICYMHTPMRYAWDDCQKYTQDFGFPEFIKRLVPFFMSPIRLWDRSSADRIDHFLTNSHFVAKRIKKYYQQDAQVIHPPVNVDRFHVSETHEDYFLIVGRLIAYKRHDIAIEAFNRLKLPLKIIGRGPEMDRLKKMAGSTIEFLGRVSEEDLPGYYAKCRGFVFPQEEDFGIVAIEAMASGRPLIAYRVGDIVEHLEEGKTGVFFDEQTSEAIVRAVEHFRDTDYDPEYIRNKAVPFDKERFKATMKDYIENAVNKHLQQR
ncbi:MAG: glycosyltransferase family 4 protein, partial [Candidatus Moranbacteria bacterium CG_4_10_14_3_um_filter_45_9]